MTFEIQPGLRRRRRDYPVQWAIRNAAQAAVERRQGQAEEGAHDHPIRGGPDSRANATSGQGSSASRRISGVRSVMLTTGLPIMIQYGTRHREGRRRFTGRK